MYKAICLIGREKIIYSIDDFKELAEEKMAMLRVNLFCPECGGVAFFRRESIDGKSACFGSNNHTETCKNLSANYQQRKNDNSAIRTMLSNSENNELPIQVTFDIYPKSKGLVFTPIKKLEGGSRVGKQRKASINARALFYSLMRDGEIGSSNAWFSFDGIYKWRAKNLFVNFYDAEPNTKPKMYWGTINYADKNMDWFNPVENKVVGIPIAKLKCLILSAYRTNDPSYFDGAGIIFFGTCFSNKESSRLIIQPWGNNLERFFIIPFTHDE
ncbi:hypothetical protein ACK3ZF_19695 [Aeromonas caviae]